MKLTLKPDPEDIEDVKSAIAETLKTEEPAAPEPDPEFITPKRTTKKNILEVRVLKRARNYRFVYANLDGERISVQVPRNIRKSLIGKTVKVARGKDADDVVTYTLIP